MKSLDRLGRFWRVVPRVFAWRLISAAKIDAFHQIPGLPFKMSLEPTFRSVGSLGVFSLGKDYEPILSYLPEFIHPGDVCIDCGANQGIYALYFATLVGEGGRVVAVEPPAYAARRIRLSALYNGLENVSVVEAAISASSGVADLHIFDEAVSATLNRTGGTIVRVQTKSIDDLAGSYNLPKVSFIKLDVEGAEFEALKGAKQVIARDRPIIMFELLDDPHSESADRVWRELVSAGYRIFCIRNGRFVNVTEARASGFDLLALSEADTGRLEGYRTLRGKLEPISSAPTAGCAI